MDYLLPELFEPTPPPAPEWIATRRPVRVRLATRDDIPFIDALQKQNSRSLGFFPRAQLEGYIDGQNVLVAEGVVSDQWSVVRAENTLSLLTTDNRPLTTPLGYLAYRDRYLKRDELGAVFQLCVAPEGRRQLIGARLVQEAFERSPIGCELFCCWCAQDLEANRFWESLGFVPIAFRTGSRSRGKSGGARVHIFWQKKIRDERTRWWYPVETGGGSIKENRIVMPIPPGMSWEDDLPTILPQEPARQLAGPTRTKKATRAEPEKPAFRNLMKRPGFGATAERNEEASNEPKPARKKKPAAQKHDPQLIRKCRELRDRWVREMPQNIRPLPSAKYDPCGAQKCAIKQFTSDDRPRLLG